MIKNNLKIAWRNLVKNKAHTFINVTGLSVGMAVAILIGLWIWDEISYDKYFQNYDRIVRVMQHQTFNGERGTQGSIPLPLGPKLRDALVERGLLDKQTQQPIKPSERLLPLLYECGILEQPEAEAPAQDEFNSVEAEATF